MDLNRVNWARLRGANTIGGLFMLPSPVWAIDTSNGWQLGDDIAATAKYVMCVKKCLAESDDATAGSGLIALTQCVHQCTDAS